MMLNPSTLLNLTPEQQQVYFALNLKQSALLIRLGQATFLPVIDMGVSHGVDLVQAMLDLLVEAQESPVKGLTNAANTLAGQQLPPARQYVAVLQATAAFMGDKTQRLKSDDGPLGTWDNVLPLLNSIEWTALDDDVRPTFMEEVTNWLHLTVPSNNEGRTQHLELLQQYVEAYPKGSVVRAMLQLIKTSQQGRYILGNGEHYNNPSVVHDFECAWTDLQNCFARWEPSLVQGVLTHERVVILHSLQKSILNLADSEEAVLQLFLQCECPSSPVPV